MGDTFNRNYRTGRISVYLLRRRQCDRDAVMARLADAAVLRHRRTSVRRNKPGSVAHAVGLEEVISVGTTPVVSRYRNVKDVVAENATTRRTDDETTRRETVATKLRLREPNNEWNAPSGGERTSVITRTINIAVEICQSEKRPRRRFHSASIASPGWPRSKAGILFDTGRIR